MSTSLENPQWDNSNIYVDFDDPRLKLELSGLRAEIEKISAWAQELVGDPDLTRVQQACALRLEALSVVGNIQSYAMLTLSVDNSHEAAKALSSQVSRLNAEIQQAFTPFEIFILGCPESRFEEIFSDSEISSMEPLFRHQRKLTEFLLSPDEEALLKGMATDGFEAWSKLYSDVSAKLSLQIDGQVYSLPEAANLLRQSERPLRAAAWKEINEAWESRSETSSMILNSLQGWRWQETRQRARRAGKEIDLIDLSCHRNKIDRETLESLMASAYEQRSLGQRALKAMAELLEVEKLAPWDLIAPAPEKSKKLTSFPEAIELIKNAFGRFNSDMADFVQMMVDNRWIDAAASPNRRGGAYCSKFYRPREPRVFMTYGGELSHVTTLAHELGHAYHTWIMRDLTPAEIQYGMTTAETASIFAETLVQDYLVEQAGDNLQALLPVLWESAQSAATMLLNIPARYDYEKAMTEARKDKSLSVRELKSLMCSAWEKHYEDSISEYDPMFWASKLHFSTSYISFYNYPYLFGYLFSLGIYAKKDDLGEKFYPKYVQILRETGVMSAEELIEGHFQQDIRKPAFWNQSLTSVSKSVEDFEKLVRELR